jgi:hypothetical protein
MAQTSQNLVCVENCLECRRLGQYCAAHWPVVRQKRTTALRGLMNKHRIFENLSLYDQADIPDTEDRALPKRTFERQMNALRQKARSLESQVCRDTAELAENALLRARELQTVLRESQARGQGSSDRGEQEDRIEDWDEWYEITSTLPCS